MAVWIFLLSSGTTARSNAPSGPQRRELMSASLRPLVPPLAPSLLGRFNANSFRGVNYATLIFIQLCPAPVWLGPPGKIPPPFNSSYARTSSRSRPRITSSSSSISLACIFLHELRGSHGPNECFFPMKYKDFRKFAPAISRRSFFWPRSSFSSFAFHLLRPVSSTSISHRSNSYVDIKRRGTIAAAFTAGSREANSILWNVSLRKSCGSIFDFRNG